MCNLKKNIKMQFGWLIISFIYKLNNAAVTLKLKAFLLMHFNFQIWHFKWNFGNFLLEDLLKIKS